MNERRTRTWHTVLAPDDEPASLPRRFVIYRCSVDEVRNGTGWRPVPKSVTREPVTTMSRHDLGQLVATAAGWLATAPREEQAGEQ